MRRDRLVIPLALCAVVLTSSCRSVRRGWNNMWGGKDDLIVDVRDEEALDNLFVVVAEQDKLPVDPGSIGAVTAKDKMDGYLAFYEVVPGSGAEGSWDLDEHKPMDLVDAKKAAKEDDPDSIEVVLAVQHKNILAEYDSPVRLQLISVYEGRWADRSVDPAEFQNVEEYTKGFTMITDATGGFEAVAPK